MNTIPNKLDNRIRDAEQAWSAVLAAQARVASAIKTNTLTASMRFALADAWQRYDSATCGLEGQRNG